MRYAILKSRPVLTQISLMVVVCCVGLFAHAQDASTSYVLMRAANDTETVQSGLVTPQADGYEIKVGQDSRIWIPRERTLFVGSSLEEVYQFKRQRISRWNSGDHFQMARWCIQHELLEQAAEHYQEVSKQYSQHPRVTQLANELRIKMLSDDGFRSYLGLAPVQESITRLAASMQHPENRSQGVVVTASATSDLVLSVPARQVFSQRIQPILRNRCSQAACHGFRSNSPLRLYEPYGDAYSRISGQNLERLLPYLTPDPETGSIPLLTQATTAHATQRKAAIELNDTVIINELANWLRMVNANVVRAAVQTSNPSNSPTTGMVTTAGGSGALTPASPNALKPVQPGQSGLAHVPSPVQNEAASGFPDGTGMPMMSEIDALEAELNQILQQQTTGPAGTPSAGPPSSDPFDAAAFNSLNQPARQQ